LLERHTGKGEERRHDGRVAVDHSNTRWCSDGFEIGCDNGERVRIAFTLDCCDREAISWVATTGGINSGDIRDLMLERIERRFGLVTRLPMPIEWLSDNGSPCTARETRAFAGKVGLVPRTTPIESPSQTEWPKPSSKSSGLLSERLAPTRCLVRALQYGSSAQGTGLPRAARVQETDGGNDDRERGRRWASTE
jgi:transposase InsO family protein